MESKRPPFFLNINNYLLLTGNMLSDAGKPGIFPEQLWIFGYVRN